MSLRSSSQLPPGMNMSTAIGSSRESNPSRRICHLREVPVGHVAVKIKFQNFQVFQGTIFQHTKMNQNIKQTFPVSEAGNSLSNRFDNPNLKFNMKNNNKDLITKHTKPNVLPTHI